MTSISKLIDRYKEKPKDFSFDELKRLFSSLGHTEKQGAGSRVVFSNDATNHKIKLHKPHPGNILKRYQLDVIENELKTKDLL